MGERDFLKLLTHLRRDLLDEQVIEKIRGIQ
jgi:hypothetical protein